MTAVTDKQNDLLHTVSSGKVPEGFSELVAETLGPVEANYEAHLAVLERNEEALGRDFSAASEAINGVLNETSIDEFLKLSPEERGRVAMNFMGVFPFRALEFLRFGGGLLLVSAERRLLKGVRAKVREMFVAEYAKRFGLPPEIMPLMMERVAAEAARKYVEGVDVGVADQNDADVVQEAVRKATNGAGTTATNPYAAPDDGRYT